MINMLRRDVILFAEDEQRSDSHNNVIKAYEGQPKRSLIAMALLTAGQSELIADFSPTTCLGNNPLQQPLALKVFLLIELNVLHPLQPASCSSYSITSVLSVGISGSSSGESAPLFGNSLWVDPWRLKASTSRRTSGGTSIQTARVEYPGGGAKLPHLGDIAASRPMLSPAPNTAHDSNTSSA